MPNKFESVIEILEFVKGTYENKDVVNQINCTIRVLKGERSVKSKKVIDMLRALQLTYDDARVKKEIGEAIEYLENYKR